MVNKVFLSSLGGVGLVGSSLVGWGLFGSERRDESLRDSSFVKEENFSTQETSNEKVKSLKRFSDLRPSVDETSNCLIFYVSGFDTNLYDGSYGYREYKQTFKSKDEALSGLRGNGLREEDLNTLLCGDGYGLKRYALSEEQGRWDLSEVQL